MGMSLTGFFANIDRKVFARESRPRLPELDRAKGLAILLVVVGHVVTGEPPRDNRWFQEVVSIIYSFHMPFFMYLSGFIMLYTFRGTDSLQEYGKFIATRFNRLAPGFFIFGVVILIGKLLAIRVLNVDNMPVGFGQGLLDILLTPGQSAAKGLWYIYVVLQLYMLYPLILATLGSRTHIVVLIAFALHFAPATPYFMIDGLFEYFVYFAIGAYFALHFDRISILLDRFDKLLIALFVVSLSLLYSDMAYPLAKLIIGCLSIPALHALVRQRPISRSEVLIKWGILSYAIYLMNTIAIGLAKGITLSFTSWDGLNFLWIGPLLFIAGFYGPIFLKTKVFPRLPPLDKITS